MRRVEIALRIGLLIILENSDVSDVAGRPTLRHRLLLRSDLPVVIGPQRRTRGPVASTSSPAALCSTRQCGRSSRSRSREQADQPRTQTHGFRIGAPRVRGTQARRSVSIRQCHPKGGRASATLRQRRPRARASSAGSPVNSLEASGSAVASLRAICNAPFPDLADARASMVKPYANCSR